MKSIEIMFDPDELDEQAECEAIMSRFDADIVDTVEARGGVTHITFAFHDRHVDAVVTALMAADFEWLQQN